MHICFICSLLEGLKSEHAQQLAEHERKHNCQTKDLTERFKVEKEASEEHVLRRQEAAMLLRRGR